MFRARFAEVGFGRVEKPSDEVEDTVRDLDGLRVGFRPTNAGGFELRRHMGELDRLAQIRQRLS